MSVWSMIYSQLKSWSMTLYGKVFWFLYNQMEYERPQKLCLVCLENSNDKIFRNRVRKYCSDCNGLLTHTYLYITVRTGYMENDDLPPNGGKPQNGGFYMLIDRGKCLSVISFSIYV